MKRTLSLVLSSIMILGIFASMPVTVNAATSGTTGDCTWTLDGTVLTISGNGKMGDYGYSPKLPWGNDITNVIIDDGVTDIGSHAFDNCSSLESISIPKSVKKINENAFFYCSNIESVYISDISTWCETTFEAYEEFNGINYYPSNPMYYTANLYLNGELVTDLVIPRGVRRVSDAAFYGCDSIQSVTIPDSVTSIGYKTFYGCKKLTTLILPDSITSVDVFAFDECIKLKDVYINDIAAYCNIRFADGYNYCDFGFCQYIYNYTSNPMYYADNLYVNGEIVADLVIPESVNRIPNYAFHGCKSLSSITIPNSVTTIGLSAFEDCLNLAEVICSDCGFVLSSKSIEAKNEPLLNAEWKYKDHTISDVWVIDEIAKCGVDGSKHKECVDCGAALIAEVIPATSKHAPSSWITDKVATVSTSGTKHKECTTCGEVLETATIPQLNPATPKVTSTNAIGGVQVNWNKIAGATKYVVYRRNAGQSNFSQIGTTTSTTFLDKNVKSGQYYCYTVRAFNATGGYSAYVSANTSTRKYMATPKLTGISNASNGLYIKWNAVAGVTEGYRVYRRGAGQTTWTYLGTVKTTYFTDTSVKYRSGEYFRYTVIADGGYHSKFDTTGLYLKRLANPALKSATSSASGITVKWETVVGTTGYYVYRKTANSGWTRIATVSGTNNTSYLDKTAKKGTTYTYTVRAVYGNTLSSYYSGISCEDKY